MQECVTCLRRLRRATSRHKCPHGIWCGFYGAPQLATRSRTCAACNAEISHVEREVRIVRNWVDPDRVVVDRTARTATLDGEVFMVTEGLVIDHTHDRAVGGFVVAFHNRPLVKRRPVQLGTIQPLARGFVVEATRVPGANAADRERAEGILHAMAAAWLTDDAPHARVTEAERAADHLVAAYANAAEDAEMAEAHVHGAKRALDRLHAAGPKPVRHALPMPGTNKREPR